MADADGDGTPDFNLDGVVVDRLPDGETFEIDPDAWNPCERACPEGGPLDPVVVGPPVDPLDPSPVSRDP